MFGMDLTEGEDGPPADLLIGDDNGVVVLETECLWVVVVVVVVLILVHVVVVMVGDPSGCSKLQRSADILK
jgi:hypothetical protein